MPLLIRHVYNFGTYFCQRYAKSFLAEHSIDYFLFRFLINHLSVYCFSHLKQFFRRKLRKFIVLINLFHFQFIELMDLFIIFTRL